MSDVKEELDKLQIERNRVASTGSLNPVPGQKSVVFMTPSIDGNVTLGFLKSYVETLALLTSHGWAVSLQSLSGDPYLSKVRNALVSTCLVNFPSATHLFFVDADVEWDAPSALRAVEHKAPIWAGIYCKKNDLPEFPCELLADKDTGKFIEVDGMFKAVMVPTGFLRVRREVYAAMAAQSLRYKDGMSGGRECWNIFEMGFAKEPQPDGMDGQWWGEDCAWGRRAMEMGYDLLVDPNVTFGHRGWKTWRHQFREFFEAYREGKATVVERGPGIVAVEGIQQAAD